MLRDLGEDAFMEHVFKLDTEDFATEEHQVIFEAVRSMAMRAAPVDVLSLGTEQQKEGKLEKVGGLAYLSGMDSAEDGTGTMYLEYASVETYVEQLKELGLRRRLVAQAEKTHAEAMSATPAKTVASEASVAFDKLANSSGSIFLPDISWNHSQKLVDMVEMDLENPVSNERLSLPWPRLECITGGLDSGLWVVASAPGVGKTSWLLQLLNHLSLAQKIPVAMISLEMSAEDITRKIVSMQTGIAFSRLLTRALTQTDRVKAVKAMRQIHSSPFHLLNAGGIKITHLLFRARSLFKMSPFKVLLVDYLQLINGASKSRSEISVADEVATELANLSMELRIPVIAAAQINREHMKDPNRRPRLSDLRNGGEAPAQKVLFLHRRVDDSTGELSPQALMFLAKNRTGRTGEQETLFDGPAQSFQEI